MAGIAEGRRVVGHQQQGVCAHPGDGGLTMGAEEERQVDPGVAGAHPQGLSDAVPAAGAVADALPAGGGVAAASLYGMEEGPQQQGAHTIACLPVHRQAPGQVAQQAC